MYCQSCHEPISTIYNEPSAYSFNFNDNLYSQANHSNNFDRKFLDYQFSQNVSSMTEDYILPNQLFFEYPDGHIPKQNKNKFPVENELFREIYAKKQIKKKEKQLQKRPNNKNKKTMKSITLLFLIIVVIILY